MYIVWTDCVCILVLLSIGSLNNITSSRLVLWWLLKIFCFFFKRIVVCECLWTCWNYCRGNFSSCSFVSCSFTIFPIIVVHIILGNIHRWFHHEGFSSSIFITNSVYIYCLIRCSLLFSVLVYLQSTTFELWLLVFCINIFWNNYIISACCWLDFVVAYFSLCAVGQLWEVCNRGTCPQIFSGGGEQKDNSPLNFTKL